MRWRISNADCRDDMAAMAEASIDAIVCDPPYGLEFMGKGWDHGVPGVEFWTAALRVLKPGGYLLAFGGTRTFHRLTCAIEDAGFEIRDQLMWLYGGGFPKSLDVAKALDKAAGVEIDSRHYSPVTEDARRWQGWGTALKPAWEPIVKARKPLAERNVAANVLKHGTGAINIQAGRIAAEDEAYRANCSGDRGHGGTRPLADTRATDLRTGGGSASDAGRWPANLVLAHSPLCGVARLVDVESPFAGDVPSNLEYGRRCMADSLRRGELPIASHLLYTQPGILRDELADERELGIAAGKAWAAHADTTVVYMDRGVSAGMQAGIEDAERAGRRVVRRWLDQPDRDEPIGCEPGCAVALLDEESGELTSGANPTRRKSDKFRSTYGEFVGQAECVAVRGKDTGGASRFFYCAKVDRAERDLGLGSDFPVRPLHWSSSDQNPGSFQSDNTERRARNPHPTVKPIALMQWCCRLVTPPGGTVYDPFAGSGTTIIAALREGFDALGSENDTTYGYVKIARARIIGDAPLLNTPAEVA